MQWTLEDLQKFQVSSRQEKANAIPDSAVSQVGPDVWEVISQSHGSTTYHVSLKKVVSHCLCPDDNNKCAHQFLCSCPDRIRPCKHSYKVAYVLARTGKLTYITF
jgi:uncharacterized Zn finger protein